MPESDKGKQNSSEDRPQTEFERFKALTSALLKVPKEEIDGKKPEPQQAPEEKRDA